MVRIIESAQNETIKKYAKLQSKKYRDESGLYLIEGGRNAHDSLCLLSASEIEAVFCEPDLADEIVAIFPDLSQKLVTASVDILKKISAYASDSEIIVVAKQRSYNEKVESECFVYLDQIRDPGNLGTIIRTAVAAGYAIMLDGCCDIFNPKVVRSCMSALSKAKVMYADFHVLQKLREDGYRVIGADMAGENIFGIAKQKTQPFVLVIGSEAHGISQKILSVCHQTASIPMQAMESLNAAVAAGILMMEYKHRIYGKDDLS